MIQWAAILFLLVITACSHQSAVLSKGMVGSGTGNQSASQRDLLERLLPPSSSSGSLGPNSPQRTVGLGCLGLLKQYCRLIYPDPLPERPAGESKVSITSIEAKRDLHDQAYYEFSKAKLLGRDRLPKDFLGFLESQGYFDLLVKYLAAHHASETKIPGSAGGHASAIPSPNPLLIPLLIQRHRLETEWDLALLKTEAKRMESRFKNLREMWQYPLPLELGIARNRIHHQLISRVSEAIWGEHPRWKGVESSFRGLKTHFLGVIGGLPIPEDLRAFWMRRIQSVRLVLPGAFEEAPSPGAYDFGGDLCLSTENDGYYTNYLDGLTVCAGDFNSEDVLQTLAHELGHALDIDTRRHFFQENSELGRRTAELRARTCMPKTFSCGEWEGYKADFPRLVSTLADYHVELPEFQRCLRRRTPSRPVREEDLDSLAAREVAESFSRLARLGIFLRITKHSIPMGYGPLFRGSYRNPYYLNPCGYFPRQNNRAALDDEVNILSFFIAEYRCGEGKAQARFRGAVETARRMEASLLKTVIRSEGEFSPRDVLEKDGFASSPAERFADVVGSYALAAYLKKMPDARQRWETFFGSSAWQCDPPSVERMLPNENNIEQDSVFDAHSRGDFRKMELFSRPIREALGCSKDFQFNECELR